MGICTNDISGQRQLNLTISTETLKCFKDKIEL